MKKILVLALILIVFPWAAGAAVYVKQSTAVTVKLGPFVDDSDGVTAETGLTIAQADIRLSKNGGDIAQTNNSAGATHDELGYYNVPLDTTDTNTLGTLKVIVSESGALPVWVDLMVVTAEVYDTLCSTDHFTVDLNGTPGVNVSQWSGTSVATPNTAGVPLVDAGYVSGDSGAADNLEAACDGTGYNVGAGSIVAASVTGAVGSVTGNVGGNITGSVGSVAAGVTVTTNNDKTGYGLADDAITASKFDETTAFPLASADSGSTQVARTGADSDTLETLSDQIDLQATASAQTTAQNDLDLLTGADGAILATSQPNYAPNTTTPPTAAAIRAEMDSNSTQLAAILADTGTTLDGKLDTIAGYLDTEIAAILEDTGTTIPGLINALNNLSAQDVWEYVTRTLTSAGSGGATAQEVWEYATRTLTANTNLNIPSAADIADAVWDEAIADHTTGTTFGGKNQRVVPSETLNDYKADVSGLATSAALATVDGNVDSILEDTNELQTNQGNWLTATGFSTHSAADVWSVETRALTDKAGFTISGTKTTLDDLNDISSGDISTACGTALDTYDPPTATEMASAFTEIKGATWSSATDTLEHIRDKQSDIETDTQDLQTQIGTDGAGLTNIPWNSAWDAEVQSECTDALNAYDPPTNTEMEARTLVAASYATASALSSHDGKLDVVDANVDLALEDTGTTIPSLISGLNNLGVSDINGVIETYKLDHLVYAADNDDVADNSIIAKLAASDGDWSGFDNSTDALEAIRDRGDVDWSSGAAVNPNLLLEAEIDAVTDQTHFTLASGSDQNDAYTDQSIVLYDDTNSDFPCVRVVSSYVGSTRTVTIDSAPNFTLGDDDSVKIFVTAPGTTAPTVGQIRAEMDANSTQLAAIVTDTDEIQQELANGGRLDTIFDAILEDTGELQANQGNWLTADLTTLESRLTAARAGYLDNLNVSGTLANSADADTYKASGYSTLTADDVWDEVLEDTVTARQMMRLFSGMLAGSIEVDGTTIYIKSLDGTINRIIFTSADGGRSVTARVVTD